MYPLLILLALLPGLAICFLIFRMDKYEKEKSLPLIISFVIGMAITIPVMFIEESAANLNFRNPDGFWTTIYIAFIAVALVEEAFKFGGLMAFPYHRPFFNEPMDGIIYSVMIGMGFATLENVLYADRFGLETALVRAFTAVPAHAAFAVILGYFVGLAKFDPKNRVLLLLKGYGVAFVVHGIYDFFILQSLYSWLIIFAMVVLGVSVYFARRMILDHQDNSPFRQEV